MACEKRFSTRFERAKRFTTFSVEVSYDKGIKQLQLRRVKNSQAFFMPVGLAEYTPEWRSVKMEALGCEARRQRQRTATETPLTYMWTSTIFTSSHKSSNSLIRLPYVPIFKQRNELYPSRNLCNCLLGLTRTLETKLSTSNLVACSHSSNFIICTSYSSMQES